MDKQEEQIESKLIELEAEVKTEPAHNMTYRPPVSDFSAAAEAAGVTSELYLFAGLSLVVAGFLLLFQHVRVGSGFFAALGMGGGGFGLLMIPMLVGVGWIMYDSKSRIG